MEEKKIRRAVFSPRCAAYIMYVHDCPLICMRQMKEDPMRNIFFFLNNEKTDNAIKDYMANKDKK